MIYWTYNTAIALSLPLLLPYILIRGRRGSNWTQGLSESLGFLEWKDRDPEDHPVWFHASSVGEVHMSLPLICAFEERLPGHSLVVSTMTLTGRETAERSLAGRATTFLLPLDLPWTMRKSLKILAPRALFIAETELWPNLLHQCHRKAIPVVIFNGRISDRSFERYRTFRFFFKEVLGGVAAFGMQSQMDADRIIQIGAPAGRVVVTGNLKFDRPAFLPDEGETGPIRRSLGLKEERSVLVAGSTHEGEEEVLLRVFGELKRIDPSLLLIIAPRHLARLHEVTKTLAQACFTWVQRSEIPGKGFSGDIILLDTMGELERIYQIATVAFVGGSLVPVGGHNILEPAAFGKPVIFGPHMENFREVVRMMKAEGGGIEVHDEDELLEQSRRLLTDRSHYAGVSKAAFGTIQRNQGAAEKTLRLFEKYL
jgi:3-deoxy-D-manno-octulosonic-acid transferase